MKRRRVILAAALSLAAAVMIVLGLFQVYRVYSHYRTDILANENRHLDSVVNASASAIDWMLRGYDRQLLMLTERAEFQTAQAQYYATGDVGVMRSLMSRRDIERVDLWYHVAVWENDALLAASSAAFPLGIDSDEAMGELCSVREDGSGGFWFIFTREMFGGLRFELAVPVQSVFAYQSESTPVGRSGYLFMTDREGRFFSYAGDGESATLDTEALLEQDRDIDRSALQTIVADTRADYMVFRYPWSEGEEETLVVTAPLYAGAEGIVVGAAMSFSEFDSYLSGTLHEVTGIILLEIGGALILLAMAAWVMLQNRRSALELSVVRERADLMEEINRQQQSVYHTERLQQLGVMTGGMVHEFNNMLTPIMGQSLLLLEQLADRDGSPEFEYALDVYEASEKAREILKRMSSMSKKDVDMGHRTIELGAVLRKTLNLSSMAKDPHIVQELEIRDEPLFVTGNEQLLTQAFLNICINACQAMGQEGTLTVTVSRQELSGRPYAVVTAADTGPGIPADSMGAIYDSFFTTKGEQGTGLGLAICKKIVETHKGTITARNRAEGGAEFTVRLPLTELPEE